MKSLDGLPISLERRDSDSGMEVPSLAFDNIPVGGRSGELRSGLPRPRVGGRLISPGQ